MFGRYRCLNHVSTSMPLGRCCSVDSRLSNTWIPEFFSSCPKRINSSYNSVSSLTCMLGELHFHSQPDALPPSKNRRTARSLRLFANPFLAPNVKRVRLRQVLLGRLLKIRHFFGCGPSRRSRAMALGQHGPLPPITPHGLDLSSRQANMYTESTAILRLVRITGYHKA